MHIVYDSIRLDSLTHGVLSGARVIMARRDLTRAERAAEEIRQQTGNGNVAVRHLDLASLHSVRQFASS